MAKGTDYLGPDELDYDGDDSLSLDNDLDLEAFYENNPYRKIDNDEGYDQSVVMGIIRQNVCGYCHGHLKRGNHPASFTFSIACHDPDCPGDTYVNKHYLEIIDQTELSQGDEVSSNLDDFDKFMEDF